MLEETARKREFFGFSINHIEHKARWLTAVTKVTN
jgi:hypothetical protein